MVRWISILSVMPRSCQVAHQAGLLFEPVAGSLSVQLTDETRRTLESVVRLTLPAENWPRVALVLRQIDEALKAGDSEGLQARLHVLREIADVGQQETVTSPDVVRYPPPMRWIVAALVGAGLLFGGAIVLVALRHFGDSGGAPVPTTTAPPAPTTAPPMPSTGSGGAGMAVVAVLVVAAVVVFFVMIRRARSRAAASAGHESVALGESETAAPVGYRAPRQLIEYADRTVRSLPAPGGATETTKRT
jgi:hypothetical protein